MLVAVAAVGLGGVLTTRLTSRNEARERSGARGAGGRAVRETVGLYLRSISARNSNRNYVVRMKFYSLETTSPPVRKSKLPRMCG